MNIFELTYFKQANGFIGNDLCADDFKQPEKHILINLDFLLSVSPMLGFKKPFTNILVGEYAIVKLSNGDTFYIPPKSRSRLMDKINGVERAIIDKRLVG